MRSRSGSRPAQHVDDRLTGIALFCVAVMIFTCLDTTAKYGSALLPTLQIVWARFTGHTILGSIGYLLVTRARRPRVRALRLQAARSACLLGATACNFTALKYLQLAETVAIFFSVPLLVSALAVPFLGEHVGRRRWIAIMVGFLGVLIVIRPGFGVLHWAAFLALAAAFFAAGYQLITRRVASIDDPATTQAATPLVGALVLLPVIPFIWQTPESSAGWLVLLAVGCFGGSGHYLFVHAHRLAPATIVAPFVYVQIVFMTIAGWLVFDDVPDIWVYLGATIVIASGIYVWHRERVLARAV